MPQVHTVISKIKLETGTSCHCQWRAEAGSELEEIGPPRHPDLRCPPYTSCWHKKPASNADVRSAEFCPHRVWKLVVAAQLLSRVWLCGPMDCSTPGFSVLHHLLELAQTRVIESVMPSSVVPFPSLNLSQHQGLSNEWVLWIRWPKYWSFSFSISPSRDGIPQPNDLCHHVPTPWCQQPQIQGQEDSVRQAPCSAKVLASVLVRPERKFEMCLYFSEIYNVNSLDKSLKMTYFDHKYVFFLLSYQNIFSTLWDFYYQILIT